MTVATERALEVLVVENDRTVELLLVLILERQGWHVKTARDVQAAIEMLQVELPDLLLLDLVPNASRHRILDWIEETNAAWMQHVILLSTESDRSLATLTKTHAVYRVVRKPFDVAELVGSVKSCCAVTYQ